MRRVVRASQLTTELYMINVWIYYFSVSPATACFTTSISSTWTELFVFSFCVLWLEETPVFHQYTDNKGENMRVN